MLFRFALLTICGFATMLVGAHPRVVEGQELEQALVGLWCNSKDKGKSCWGFDEFHKDGTVTSCALIPGKSATWYGRGRYTVQGSTACFLVTDSSESQALRKGARFCTKILEINAQVQKYRDEDTGSVTVMYRKPPHAQKNRSPCTKENSPSAVVH